MALTDEVHLTDASDERDVVLNQAKKGHHRLKERQRIFVLLSRVHLCGTCFLIIRTSMAIQLQTEAARGESVISRSRSISVKGVDPRE